MVDTTGPRLWYKSSSPSWHYIYFLSKNNKIDNSILVRSVLWALPVQSKAPALTAAAPGSFLKCRIQVPLQTCLVWIRILTPGDLHAHQKSKVLLYSFKTPSPLPTPSVQVITVQWVGFPVLCRTSHQLSILHMILHMFMLLSPFIPLSPSTSFPFKDGKNEVYSPRKEKKKHLNPSANDMTIHILWCVV